MINDGIDSNIECYQFHNIFANYFENSLMLFLLGMSYRKHVINRLQDVKNFSKKTYLVLESVSKK